MEILALRGQEGVNQWSMRRRSPAGTQGSSSQGRLRPYSGAWATFSVTYRSPQKPSSRGACSRSCSTAASRKWSCCSSAQTERASASVTRPSLLPSAAESSMSASAGRLA